MKNKIVVVICFILLSLNSFCQEFNDSISLYGFGRIEKLLDHFELEYEIPTDVDKIDSRLTSLFPEYYDSLYYKYDISHILDFFYKISGERNGLKRKIKLKDIITPVCPGSINENSLAFIGFEFKSYEKDKPIFEKMMLYDVLLRGKCEGLEILKILLIEFSNAIELSAKYCTLNFDCNDEKTSIYVGWDYGLKLSRYVSNDVQDMLNPSCRLIRKNDNFQPFFDHV